MTAAKHHIDKHARELLDRLADDLEDDTLMTTHEAARWLNVSSQFLEIGRAQGYGPPDTVLSPKVVRYRKNRVLRWLIERERAYTNRTRREHRSWPAKSTIRPCRHA